MSKKLKPFDLKTALNGEPVILRDGSKASGQGTLYSIEMR